LIRDRAAKRYAQAAFELAREKGEIDAWERDLTRLADALRSPGAMAFLSSRQAPDQAKEAVLQQALGQPQALVWNLMRLLVAKGRTALLPQIIEAFQELVDEERGIAHAQVVTAVSMSDDERDAIARRLSELTGKHVQIETTEDPEILGGLVARIGDRLIDGSARTRLVVLKRQLAGSSR
jgi:F-type H+-transporting ATPase subunit delta